MKSAILFSSASVLALQSTVAFSMDFGEVIYRCQMASGTIFDIIQSENSNEVYLSQLGIFQLKQGSSWQNQNGETFYGLVFTNKVTGKTQNMRIQLNAQYQPMRIRMSGQSIVSETSCVATLWDKNIYHEFPARLDAMINGEYQCLPDGQTCIP